MLLVHGFTMARRKLYQGLRGVGMLTFPLQPRHRPNWAKRLPTHIRRDSGLPKYFLRVFRRPAMTAIFVWLLVAALCCLESYRS
jgi:hypothetical protein